MQEFNQTIKIPPETLPETAENRRSQEERRFLRANGESSGPAKIPAGKRRIRRETEDSRGRTEDSTQLAAALKLSLSLSLSLTRSFSLTNHSFLG